MEYHTGYNKENYTEYIFENCNSGMERVHNGPFYILKAPDFIRDIEKIVTDKEIIIKTVIIPIRNYKESAKSRFNIGTNGMAGGLWESNNIDEHINLLFIHIIKQVALLWTNILAMNIIYH